MSIFDNTGWSNKVWAQSLVTCMVCERLHPGCGFQLASGGLTIICGTCLLEASMKGLEMMVAERKAAGPPRHDR